MKRDRLLQLFFVFLSTAFTARKDSSYLSDFYQFWEDVKNNYAYFDKKHTDWDKVKTYYKEAAEAASSRDELISVLEHASEELYDNHFNLNVNLKTSTRLVPSGLDLWAEYKNGKAIITEIRPGFSVYKAGIKPGMIITGINNTGIDEAINKRIGKCISLKDDEVKSFVLRQLLAGDYVSGRILTLVSEGKQFIVKPDFPDGNLTDKHQYSSLLESNIFEKDIGYIKFNNSLGNNDLISQFDSVLLQFKTTKALILDLRETPGGGNSTVARGIMSRFINRELPYQKHLIPAEEKEYGVRRSWLELVTPRGPFTYNNLVILLVNHWTGSMGEGIAIGFSGINRATIVGTKMAGLNGAVDGFSTKTNKIPYSFPTEQVYHINGTPREDYTPDILVDLLNPVYRNTPDPILEVAMEYIRKNEGIH